jgi:hypothetical protein
MARKLPIRLGVTDPTGQLQGATRLNDYFDAMDALGLPIFVGEYGNLNVSSNAESAILGLFQTITTRHIGALAWHWSSGSGRGAHESSLTIPGGGVAVDNCTNPTNLTPCEGTAAWQYAHGETVSPTCN